MATGKNAVKAEICKFDILMYKIYRYLILLCSQLGMATNGNRDKHLQPHHQKQKQINRLVFWFACLAF